MKKTQLDARMRSEVQKHEWINSPEAKAELVDRSARDMAVKEDKKTQREARFVNVGQAHAFVLSLARWAISVTDVKMNKIHKRGDVDPYAIEWIVSWDETGVSVGPQCRHGNVVGYCAECGKQSVITCQRCDGIGELDADERGMVKCPVCDGEAAIDYAMVAEYARQIDALTKQLRQREGTIRTTRRS